MARQSAPLEINKFIAGLVTDANPLTFPDNASVEEENFVLNIDGSRKRRLGMDFEEDFVEIETTQAIGGDEPAFSSYKWNNAGGDPEKSILVIQIGTEVKFFDLDYTPMSSGLIYTYNFASASVNSTFSYATVDGILVIVTGEKQPHTFIFTAPASISVSAITLKIRDLFNVADTIGTDLYENLNKRPSSTSNAHTYNLRNSTWHASRPQGSTEAVDDPITYFKTFSGGNYPSNSDSVNSSLYADPTDTGGPTLRRFFAEDLVKNPRGSVPAPTGHFIIDALQRGASRLNKEADNRAAYPTLDFSVSTLPQDETPGGPSAVAEFAGRIWYGGFSGEVIGGDDRSPRMSSFLLFSQLVESRKDIAQCYQVADPTNPDQSDLVATDGGFVRINEAYGIKGLVNVGASLLILATNGIWRIYGGSDYGFDATNYVVERITDHGIVSLNSIVNVDNTLMFWGADGIYHIHPTDNGFWVSENITYGTIQTLYENINIVDKQKAKGAFDSFERRVRWVYSNRLDDETETKELVLDINLKAFYLNAIKQFDANLTIPRLLTPFKVNPFTVTETTTPVLIDIDPVVVGVDDVVVGIQNILGNSVREIAYLAVTQLTPVIKYTFAYYRNSQFRDWFSQDGVGVDAAAYMVTGYFADAPGGKDFHRYKQIPYLYVHCRRTETGFEEDANDDLQPLNASSCLVQTRWEWSNSSNSNRWGREFQAYRYRKLYLPEDVNDAYDTGFQTIVTKNKLRGRGKVVSIKFSTEPYKDLHLYGWSMIMSIAGNV